MLRQNDMVKQEFKLDIEMYNVGLSVITKDGL